MKSLILSCIAMLLFSVSEAQVIYTETFDEGDGSTSGSDNTNGVGWTSSCGACTTGDYWEVRGGGFENNDSNGPATWSSGTIDVNGCAEVEVCFDITVTNGMEACGTGCNSVDWVYMTYALGDGMGGVGAATDPPNAYACGGTCAGMNVIWDGGAMGTSFSYCSGALNVAGNVDFEIEIGSQTWAQDEFITIDNLEITCFPSLPIDLLYFDAESRGNHNLLKWKSTDKSTSFQVEKSADGRSFALLATITDNGESGRLYEYVDEYPESSAYYRLKSPSGEKGWEYSDIVHVQREHKWFSVQPNPSAGQLYITSDKAELESYTIEVRSVTGDKVCETSVANQKKYPLDLSDVGSGVYFIHIYTATNSEVHRVVME